MKKIVIALIGTLCLVAGTASIAIAASRTASIRTAASTTPTDVNTLAFAESHVVTLLHNYRSTALWKSQFKAAVAQQNVDIAKVNADLAPPTANAAVLFSGSGSGMESTRPFTVPASAKGWHVNWAYNCASFGMAGNFDFSVYQGTQLDFNDNGPNQLSTKGSGTEHFYDTGTFHLSMSSECAWTVQAVAGS
jgi:hypothetical protein